MDEFIAMSRALSDTNRVRALMALRGGELCVCQIIELLGLAPSTVSKHMSVLRQAGLVIGRKQERWMYYRLPDKNKCTEFADSAIKWAVSALETSDIVAQDKSRLLKITCQDLSKLCKFQRNR
jgi:ArsR family transcriptional regulator